MRFNGKILQHLEMEDAGGVTDGSSGSVLGGFPAIGSHFGIVCKMDRSYRSHAHYGVLCECEAVDLDKVGDWEVGFLGGGEYRSKQYVHIRAQAKHRFRIDQVLHRGLDGLILTAMCTVFEECGTPEDIDLSANDRFKALKSASEDHCNVLLKSTISPTRVTQV